MRRTNQDAFSDELNGIKSPVLGGLELESYTSLLSSQRNCDRMLFNGAAQQETAAGVSRFLYADLRLIISGTLKSILRDEVGPSFCVPLIRGPPFHCDLRTPEYPS